MKIVIVGLGLIGGSYASGLSQKGHEVYGIDKDVKTLEYAKKKGYIKITDETEAELLSTAELIILAIYPQAILEFLNKNKMYFTKHQIITDVCGVKSSFINKATLLSSPAVYLSHHPMAGKEKIGIAFADSSIFAGANFLITPLEHTPIEAIKTLDRIARDLNFGRITLISPKRHDEMIGFTSQLTHAIAVSLVNSDKDKETIHFIGDSYRDLTRIAMINENLWSELFLENKDALLAHIENFETELNILKKALYDNDKEQLNELFKNSTHIRKKMEKCAN